MMSETPISGNKTFRDVVLRVNGIVTFPVPVSTDNIWNANAGSRMHYDPFNRVSGPVGSVIAWLSSEGWFMHFLEIFLLLVSSVASVLSGSLVTLPVDTVFWIPSSSMVMVSRGANIMQSSPTVFDSTFGYRSWVRRAPGVSCSGGRSKNAY